MRRGLRDPLGGVRSIHKVNADSDLVLSPHLGPVSKGTEHTRAKCCLPGACGLLRVLRELEVWTNPGCSLLKEPLVVHKLDGVASQGVSRVYEWSLPG